MPIDIETEELVPLNVATKFFPRRQDGKRRHVSSLYRYTTVGCRGVVLESVQCSTIRCTSREAVIRFFKRLTDASRLTPLNHEANAKHRHDEENRNAEALGL